MQSEPSKSKDKREVEEIDLLQFFKGVGQLLTSAVKSIIGAIVLFLVFIRRLILRYRLMLVIGFIIGSLVGGLFAVFSKPYFSTSAVMRSQFLQGVYFLEEVEKLDRLCKENDYASLGDLLQISPENAAHIKSFNAALLNEVKDMYSYYGDPDALDSAKLADALEGGNFQVSVSIYQEGSKLIHKIEDGLLTYMSGNTYVQKRYQAQKTYYENSLAGFQKELNSLDSLKNAINISLASGAPAGASGTVILSESEKNAQGLVGIYRESTSLRNKYMQLEQLLAEMEKIEYVNSFTQYNSHKGIGLAKAAIYGALIGLSVALLLALLLSLDNFLRGQ